MDRKYQPLMEPYCFKNGIQVKPYRSCTDDNILF